MKKCQNLKLISNSDIKFYGSNVKNNLIMTIHRHYFFVCFCLYPCILWCIFWYVFFSVSH